MLGFCIIVYSLWTQRRTFCFLFILTNAYGCLSFFLKAFYFRIVLNLQTKNQCKVVIKNVLIYLSPIINIFCLYEETYTQLPLSFNPNSFYPLLTSRIQHSALRLSFLFVKLKLQYMMENM